MKNNWQLDEKMMRQDNNKKRFSNILPLPKCNLTSAAQIVAINIFLKLKA
jgi:hypothetical protein